MSGHSKWHNIQARKGKQDAKRSNLFTKYAKAITIAAQQGGGDPNMNFSLRLAIEKSRAIGMPKDNIDRAVKRGTGELAGAGSIEEALYEGFGPGGVAVLIKAVTDNKNRAVQEIKHILVENGGSLAGSGSVQWMFQQWGVVMIPANELAKLGTKDEAELQLIELGAEDIGTSDEAVEVKIKVENFQKVITALRQKNVEIKDSGLQWIAKDPVKVDPALEEKIAKLFGDFEENDDVEDYYTNAE